MDRIEIIPARLAELSDLVERLAAARRDGFQITDLPEGLTPASIDEAYGVHRAAMARTGLEPLGWKIAGTTQEVRDKLNLPGPIYGRTFRRDRHVSPGRFEAGAMLDPLIECETFVTLAHDLPFREEPWTMDEVVEAIGEVHAGIEVAECRFPSRSTPPLRLVLADGSAAGRYVFGDRIADWKRRGLSGLGVALEIDGEIRRRGSGAEVMGDPLRPLLWLAEEQRRWGEGLKAGETISTGSMTGMIRAKPGHRVRAIYADGAEVAVDFD
ncbi:MAG: hypothetical protein VYD87_13095 [Pseudomonadota bacterium]|nr:hypothetical protein [Pseudomonadota bacterium]